MVTAKRIGWALGAGAGSLFLCVFLITSIYHDTNISAKVSLGKFQFADGAQQRGLDAAAIVILASMYNRTLPGLDVLPPILAPVLQFIRVDWTEQFGTGAPRRHELRYASQSQVLRDLRECGGAVQEYRYDNVTAARLAAMGLKAQQFYVTATYLTSLGCPCVYNEWIPEGGAH